MSETVELHYVERGAGTSVVLIHGFPLSHESWEPQVEALAAAGCRAIAPDLRGHGRSPVTGGVYSMALLAGDVLALLDRLGVERAIFAGHSMGGYVSFAVLRLGPDRVAGLALISTRAAPDSPEARAARLADAEAVLERGPADLAGRMIGRFFAEGFAERQPEAVASVRRVILETPREAIAGALRGMAGRPDSSPLLPSLSVPALVVTGDADRLIPPAESRAMAAAIPGAHLEVMAGVGHMPQVEQPAGLSGLLVEFAAATR